MKREIILHAGTHKTGTSSIQSTFLGLDQPDLAYLRWGVKTPSGHNAAYSQAFVAKPEELIKKHNDISTTQEAAAFQAKLRSGLQEAMTKATASRVLISAEAIANSSEENVADLKATLDPYASKYRVIIYARSPISYTGSSLPQSLKSGAIRDFPPRYNYIAKLTKMAKLFGTDAVEVYEFARDKLVDGNVVADFAHRLGFSDVPLEVKESNVSTSLEVSALYYLYWQFFKPKPRIVSETIISLAMAHALADLGTAKLRVHTDVLGALVTQMDRQFVWMEKTFGIRFDKTLPEGDDGITMLDDLIPIAMAQEDKLRAITTERLASSPAEAEKVGPLTAQLTALKDEAHTGRRVAGIVQVLRELMELEMKINPALRHIR